MTRRLIVCGNWKLHHLAHATQSQLENLLRQTADSTKPEVDLVVAPVATVLHVAQHMLRNTPVQLAAQNVHWEKNGAYTGEWSIDHLVEAGCKWVIIGHSERRQYFGETDSMVAKKLSACVEDGRLTSIVCVGESQQERQSNKTMEVLKRQMGALFEVVSAQKTKSFVVAYEPIWAIGTGLNATPSQAEDTHSEIRLLVKDALGPQSASELRLIYGGSVKPDNALVLMQQTNIDGVLVGGASLQAESLAAIHRSAGLAWQEKNNRS